jgi:cellulose synthase/poly-beta-1,6-N-acetylglucosamine synthase-like glycosyltransferase
VGDALVFLNCCLFSVAFLLLIPVSVLCMECIAALLPCRKVGSLHSSARPRLAVLIPAHNEQSVLRESLQALMPQLREGDRVLVVADNCEDTTSEIALRHGAEVVERHDAQRVGKGYALHAGIVALASGTCPEILVMMDADCHAQPGALDALARQVVETGRPAQACYLMEPPAQTRRKDLVSTLAFLVKNRIRPLGLRRMGLACPLNGTGMAFPWEVIRSAELDHGNIVEDMQLGLDLAMAGHAPLFCDAANVTGILPANGSVAIKQRTRWEHGHLRTLITQIPRLLKIGLTQFRLSPLVLAVDLAVPPLSLLAMMLLLALTVSIIAAVRGASWVPAELLLAGTLMTAGTLLGAWAKFGRHWLPLTSLLAAPLYMVWKIPMYFAFVLRPQAKWVRTSRSVPLPPPDH